MPDHPRDTSVLVAAVCHSIMPEKKVNSSCHHLSIFTLFLGCSFTSETALPKNVDRENRHRKPVYRRTLTLSSGWTMGRGTERLSARERHIYSAMCLSNPLTNSKTDSIVVTIGCVGGANITLYSRIPNITFTMSHLCSRQTPGSVVSLVLGNAKEEKHLINHVTALDHSLTVFLGIPSL